jgi:hypothetical protein
LADQARAEGEAAAEWTVSIFKMIRDLFTSTVRIVRILAGFAETGDDQQVGEIYPNRTFPWPSQAVSEDVKPGKQQINKPQNIRFLLS